MSEYERGVGVGVRRGYVLGRRQDMAQIEELTEQNARLVRERDVAMEALAQLWEAARRYGPGTLRTLAPLFRAMNRAKAVQEGAASGHSASETRGGDAATAPSASAGRGQRSRETQGMTAAPVAADDLLHAAWGVIANAGGGDWEYETKEWREAAERWRDRYHEWLLNVREAEEGAESGQASSGTQSGAAAPAPSWERSVTTWLPDQSGWGLRLNRYQRDNLLLLLNAIGYPAGPSWPNPHIDPALAHWNTGDWVGEIALMLARTDGSIVIDARDLPNPVHKAQGEGPVR